jgi:hypothetical protein
VAAQAEMLDTMEQGRATPVTGDLASSGVNVALVGLTWHNGAFYISHRAADLTGAVSRVSMDGQVSKVFDGIVDSQAKHQVNDRHGGHRCLRPLRHRDAARTADPGRQQVRRLDSGIRPDERGGDDPSLCVGIPKPDRAGVESADR